MIASPIIKARGAVVWRTFTLIMRTSLSHQTYVYIFHSVLTPWHRQSPSGSQPPNATLTPSRAGSRIDTFGSPRPSFSYPTPSSGAHAGLAHIPPGQETPRLIPSSSFETPRRLHQPHESYPTPDSNDRPWIRHEHFEEDNVGQVVSAFLERSLWFLNILTT